MSGDRPTAAPDRPDLADLRFWGRPPAERDAVFAALRAEPRPVFFPEPRTPLARSGKGFYALVRHADVLEASRNVAVFGSAPSVMSPDSPRWLRHLVGESMVNLDDPRHKRLRGLVSRAFTPRRVEALDSMIAQAVDRVVDDVLRAGTGDVVELVSARLPLQVITGMLGIPAGGVQEIARHVALVAEYTGVRSDLLGSAWLGVRNVASLIRLQRMVVRLAEQRRAEPGSDLLSILATADIDGDRLDDRDLGAFFTLLLVAGDVTVQSAITWGLVLLSRYPDQRELLMSDLDGLLDSAVSEILRFATPIHQFRRTVRQPYVLGGQAFEPGDRVGLFYGSANRDESVFADADRFRIDRDPNPQLAFGGGGPHYCLGAQLGRRQLVMLFRQLLTRAPEIRTVGEPELMLSNFDNAIRRVGFTVGGHR